MFILNKKSPCLCGSGKKFKHCCLPYINCTDTEYEQQLELQNFKIAYQINQAMLTKYLIAIKRDTEPFLRKNIVVAKELLKIDIEAVSEYIERLLFVKEKGNLNTDIYSSLLFISHLLINESWTQRINYYIALFYSLQKDYERAGQTIAVYTIDDLIDVRLMQIYYQLQSQNLGIKKVEELINKIVDSEESFILKLKYKFSLALHYFFINDEPTALELAKDVIKTLETTDADIVPKSIYDYFVLSDIYSFFAQMTNNYMYATKAIEYLVTIKDNTGLTIKGEAHTRTLIGYNYILLHNYDEAIKCLIASNEYVITPISMIYLADAYLEKGNEQAAKKILYEFAFDDIEEDCVDYLMVISKFLLKYPDYKKFREIRAILKLIDLNSQPYFNLMVKDLLLELSELYSDSNIESDKVRWKWLKKLNDILILQPNAFGIGINFNEIINEINVKCKDWK